MKRQDNEKKIAKAEKVRTYKKVAKIDERCAISTSAAFDFINSILLHPLRDKRRAAIGRHIDLELSSRAGDHGTSFKLEQLKAARAALAIALDELARQVLTPTAWEKELRKRVSDRFTELVLGEDWRRSPKLGKKYHLLAFEETKHGATALEEAEVRLQFDIMARQLTNQENALLALMREGHTEAEIARGLRIKPSAVRMRYARIRKKINPPVTF